jgi:hypothetical protein
LIVPQRLRQLGFQGAVALSDYWDAVEREELNVLATKVNAFAGLCLYARTGVIDLSDEAE